MSTSKQLNSPSLPPNVIPIFEFELATTDELKQIVMMYGIKCSPDDPVPAFLLKENVDVFIPYWLEIVNLSLQVGSMDCLKIEVIIPSLVDKENFKNYRPVWNLLFLSKLIERIVDIRLEKDMSANNLQ